ncbi:cytochrome b5 domain-containing protein [Clostridium tunisiense]|uniref:cytochrome b5 domain-containing protein n=1 Tax=Clostridium tunisiense TaxID=219748 RepID=UPI0002EC6A01|nr:cytochrome b5 domain-containing protein [Clostridium tunisiense]
MDFQTNLKEMYKYFTEINKKIYLIQWEYKDRFAVRETVPSNNLSTADRVFTIEELKQYDGSNNNPAYVAVDGIVYDVTLVAGWGGGTHFGVKAGTDATEQYYKCHGLTYAVNKLPKIGVLQK